MNQITYYRLAGDYLYVQFSEYCDPTLVVELLEFLNLPVAGLTADVRTGNSLLYRASDGFVQAYENLKENFLV